MVTTPIPRTAMIQDAASTSSSMELSIQSSPVHLSQSSIQSSLPPRKRERPPKDVASSFSPGILETTVLSSASPQGIEIRSFNSDSTIQPSESSCQSPSPASKNKAMQPPMKRMRKKQGETLEKGPTYGSLSLYDKIQLINEVIKAKNIDAKTSVSAVARRLDINIHTANKIWKNKDLYMDMMQGKSDDAAKAISRTSSRTMEAIEHALLSWLEMQRSLKIIVTDARLKGTGAILWSIMKDYYEEKQLPDSFAFSNGWLHRFKTRSGISSKIGHGESWSVDMGRFQIRMNEIKTLLSPFHPDDIYNCGETVLYLRALSARMLVLDPVHDTKIIRAARVSILICSNSTGTGKRKLFVLSKHKPKGVTEDTLSKLDSNTCDSGCMTKVLFDKWLQDLDQDMQGQGRKIALLIDSAPGHCGGESTGLRNIKIIQLPPGTTSITQPMDAGVIRSFKIHYSQEMFEAVARVRERRNSSTATASYASLWACLVKAWDTVSPNCIRSCFAHVPTLPDDKNQLLRNLGVESVDNRLKELQEELIQKYDSIADVVSKQKDFTILNYLTMCHAEGPIESITSCAMMTIEDPKFRTTFRSHKDDDFIDEEEVEDAKDLDVDYDQLPNQGPSPPMVITILRSRATQIIHDGYFSPETSPPKRRDAEAIRNILRNFIRVTEEILISNDEEAKEELDRLYDTMEAFLDRYLLRQEEISHRRDPSLLENLRACLQEVRNNQEE